jgi:hypothetical protein
MFEGLDQCRGPAIEFLRSLMGHQGDECVTWPFSRVHGYGGINLKLAETPVTTKAHRVMCFMAHGAPPTPQHQASHSCGKGHEGCVNPAHLSWKTASENQRDRRRHGTAGHQNKHFKLTSEAAAEILALRGKETVTSLAKRFNVHRSTINQIHAGKIYKGGKRALRGSQLPHVREALAKANARRVIIAS